ncbi:MAG: HAD family hydrolase [Stygiobacter sp.]|jgi:phosphoglycolate phosphatase|uniref:phosphoglycolate phosphatase n=1 Tax=Stygiobacter electus TaxID=3032292 RepID=A0AAE3NWH4_9BACT|nr:HAD family hydrolase [Stygiobacter electus]MDF1612221.1 HAD family hydrolase [Stygiobacter electus]
MKLRNYKHVIWDWNGTILNDAELSLELINGLLKERNKKVLTLDEYKKVFTIPVKNYYSALGFDFEKESFEIVGKKWMDEYERRKFECNIYNGITDVLEKIKQLQIGQSILSAYSQHTLEEMANYFGLTKYFEHIVGLDNIYAAGKLHLGQMLIKKLGNGKGETLMIGDTLHDYEVAQEIGADCILLSCGHQDKERLLATECKVIDDIKELLEL